MIRVLSFVFGLLLALDGRAAQAASPTEQLQVEAELTSAVVELRDGDSAAFDEILDIHLLIDRVLQGLDYDEGNSRAFRLGAAAQKSTIVENFSRTLAMAYSVSHLKTAQDGQYVTILYRLDFGDQGLNYFEYLIEPESMKIVDWFDFAIGQYVSETMRSIALGVTGPDATGGFFSSILDGSAARRNRLIRMALATRDLEFDKAVNLYREAPEDFKSLDPALSILIVAGSNIQDPDEYEFVLQQIATYGAGDPRYAFILIDHYLLRGEYQLSIDAAELLQSRMGIVEAGVEELKAGIRLAQGDHTAAIEYFENAAKIEPERDNAFGMLFELNVMEGKYAAAQRVLDTLNERFDYGLVADDFSGEPGFEGFLEWSVTRARARPPRRVRPRDDTK